MVRMRFKKRVLLAVAVLIALPALWVLQIEITYERNVRRGIPADFRVHRPHVVNMWKA